MVSSNSSSVSAGNPTIISVVNAGFLKTINISLVGFKDMISSIIVVYMLLGIGIGALGSVISMRKYLKV